MSIDWDAREYPGYQPAQLDPDKANVPCSFCDWWNRRSWLCCCCFPCIQCANGLCNPCLAQRVDALDPEIYKKTLEMPTKCPEELKGVWWLQDNIAAESLVNFNDSFFEDKGDGNLYWEHDVPQSWLRDYSVFGLCLGTVNACLGITKCAWKEWQQVVSATFNFEKGKGKFDEFQWVYKINEDEWQKASYAAKVGEPKADEVTYMYRWRRVMRGDGSTTAAWDEMKEVMQSPLPKKNCCAPWCPFWPLCISKKDILLNMTYNNQMQVVIFPPEQRRPPMYSGCCCEPKPVRCPCMWPCCANIHGVWKKNFPGPTATTYGKDSV